MIVFIVEGLWTLMTKYFLYTSHVSALTNIGDRQRNIWLKKDKPNEQANRQTRDRLRDR